MGELVVLFDVKPYIEQGLATGFYERVGGVIREIDTGKVVMWLREGANIDNQANNPVNAVLGALKSSRTVSGSAQMLTMLRNLTMAGQVMNLGLALISLGTITNRLDMMSRQLDTLGAKLIAEFEQDREISFKSALKDAGDVFSEVRDRDSAHRQATKGLFEAREHFLANCEKALVQASKPEYLQLAQYYLLRAMYAETVRIKCYVAMDERRVAIKHLQETLRIFKDATISLIRAYLGKASAVYFHKNIDSEQLARFLNIQKWLNQDSTKSDYELLFDIIDNLRNQFWDEAVLEDNLFRKITRTGGAVISRKEGTVLDAGQIQRLTNNLLQAELLIENFERFVSFELEIREERLAEVEIDEEKLAQHGSALIIDNDVLQRLQIEQ